MRSTQLITGVEKPFLENTRVRAAARLAGTKLTVSGTAVRTTKVKPVREVIDDGGLRVAYDKRSTPPECDDAFSYRLKVRKTSIVD